jgi:hypothetical protein
MIFTPLTAPASVAKYKEVFDAKVHQFGNINRFNSMNINRDRYANCIMQVRIKTILDQTGRVISTEVTDPAPVPIVNKYFTYIIENVRPHEPLSNYIDSPPRELVIEKYYKLRISLYEYQKVTEPCK